MAYIGRGLDKISNVEKLDNLTFDGSSTSFALQKGGSSFVPSSANNILLSIDGVVQAGNFTVSGSTIDFGVAPSGSSTCDFILHYGVGVITTPADGSVTTAKIQDSSVSLAKLTATGTKDATTFLRGDNTFNTLPASGITEADQWRLTALLTGDANPISSNLERNDSSGFNYIGTGMTESSGVFTFPSTGIYYIIWQGAFRSDSADSRYCRLDLDVTTNNSTYTGVAYAMTALSYVNSSTYDNAMGQYIFDVTDTSTHKVRFAVEYAIPATTSLLGTTTENYTSFTFIRLGDT